MKILFYSTDLIAGNIAYLLQKEGNDVRLYIKEKGRQRNFDSLVSKIKTFREGLRWVGKDGLIVFDDVGYGDIQDKLRKKGYTVFGGTLEGDRLELSREYGQKIFAEHGMKTAELKDFSDIDEAVKFIKKNQRPWVIKQNNHASKTMNYVSSFSDGRDSIAVLKNYLVNKNLNRERITLQERVDGVEIGVGRYFNGNDWVGPIEMNLEHKKFLAGDVGPTTSEMGTVAWYDDNENNKLFKETLFRLKPFLQKINFRGDIEINCIVNEKGSFPLEATPRLGSPIIHLHSEIHTSPWAGLLNAVASGKQYDLEWKRGWGIVVTIAVPPFPYSKKENHNLFYGTKIFFDNLTPEEMGHIHFEEVSKRVVGREEEYYISDNRGYVLYVTAIGDTVQSAQEKVYGIIKKLVIPKMMYRNDVGNKFLKEGMSKLKSWGYL